MGMCLLAITCCLSKTILQKKKKQNLVKLRHTKPFLQNRDRVIQMFSLQDNSGGKIRQALSLSDSSKKRSQNRSHAALQDNDSVKFKFVYAL